MSKKKKNISIVVSVLSKEMQFPDCQERTCVNLGDVFCTPDNEMCFCNLTAVILVLATMHYCCSLAVC